MVVENWRDLDLQWCEWVDVNNGEPGRYELEPLEPRDAIIEFKVDDGPAHDLPGRVTVEGSVAVHCREPPGGEGKIRYRAIRPGAGTGEQT